ncbi:hypothetical protein ACFL2Q_10400 [Thermodesulfobacteriota bacterium]
MILKLRRPVILLLIIALSVPWPCHAVGANGDDSENLRSIKEYEEITAKSDYSTMQKYRELANKEWVELYRHLWRIKGMDGKLRKIVDAAVDAQVEKTGYWDRVKGVWDEKVIGKVLKTSVDESVGSFESLYRDFLEGLSEPYSEILGALVQKYAKETSVARKFAAESLPGHDALLDLSLDRAVVEIQTSYRVPDIDAPVRPGTIAVGVTGVAILALRKVLQKRLVNALVKKLLGAAGRKVIFVLEGPIGWGVGVGLLGYDVYSIGSEISNIPEKLKSEVFKSMRSLYYVQAPKAMWEDALRDQVKMQLTEVRDLVSGDFDAGVKELMGCASFQEAAAKADKKEQNALVTKLYALRNRASISLCRLSDRLASVLLQTGTQELACIQRGIKNLGLDTTADWLDLAPRKLCVLMDIPLNQLVKYEPNKENLDRLLWASAFPEDIRRTALGLDTNTRKLIRGLPTNKQVQLMQGRTTDQVAEELERLGKAADGRDFRKSNETADSLTGQVKAWISGTLSLFVPTDKSRQLADTILVVSGIIAVLFILLLLRKLGIIRLMKWLLTGGAVADTPKLADNPRAD